MDSQKGSQEPEGPAYIVPESGRDYTHSEKTFSVLGVGVFRDFKDFHACMSLLYVRVRSLLHNWYLLLF